MCGVTTRDKRCHIHNQNPLDMWLSNCFNDFLLIKQLQKTIYFTRVYSAVFAIAGGPQTSQGAASGYRFFKENLNEF